MKQRETFAELPPSDVREGRTGWAQLPEMQAAFLLGRAVAILEGLMESPTDAIDIQLARDLLADYRKWMEQES